MRKRKIWLAILLVISLLISNSVSSFAGTRPPAPTFSASPTAPTNGNVTVTVNYPSNAVNKQYKLGSNGTWLNYSGPFIVSSNCYVYAQYKNRTGQWSALGGYNITNIDRTPPVSPVFSASTTAPTNQNITLTINYSSDSATKQYKVGSSGIYQIYSGPISLSSNTTVYAKASDTAGNWTPETSYNVTNIDTTAPDVPTLSADITSSTSGNVNVTIDYPNDAYIKQYKLGSIGTWNNYTVPVAVSSNDTVYARCQDSAGNWSGEGYLVISNIDKTAPADPTFNPSTAALTNQDVTVTINYSDDSTVKLYKVGSSGVYQDYTTPVVIVTNDTIYAKASNGSGSWTNEVSYTVSNIDKTPPVNPVISPSTTALTSQDVTISINFSNDSVIKQYSTSSSAGWTDYTAPFILSSNDTIYSRACDSAGNWTSNISYDVINIDKTAPANPVFTSSNTASTTQPVTVSITYSDDSSSKLYKVGNAGVWTSYTTPITLNSNNTVYAKASDVLGNWTPEVSYAVTNIFPTKQVLGYTVNSSAYNVMTANVGTLSEIATSTWGVDGLGNLSGAAPTDQISFANSSGMKSNLAISNNYDATIAKTLLESAVNRTNLENNILSTLKTYNYTGVNIDIENIPAADRSYLMTFMSEVYSKLKPLGYGVSIAVPAKTYDSSTATWNYAFDYKALANYSDYLMIMAYDEHYSGGTPGAIASIGWVTNVVNYALTVVPKEKITLGLAAYGYDWASNGTTKAYSINGCYNIAATYGATVLLDSTTKSKYFTYTDSTGINHTVWFEDADTISYKLDLVNSSDLRGIGIWRLGLENTNYWSMIKSKFNK